MLLNQLGRSPRMRRKPTHKFVRKHIQPIRPALVAQAPDHLYPGPLACLEHRQ